MVWDGGAVREDSLVECEHTDGQGGVTYNRYLCFTPGLKAHYWNAQMRDEIFILKHYDSHDVEATCAPHASFHEPTIPDDQPTRSTIETTTWVFTMT